jgi:VWFA-related protein
MMTRVTNRFKQLLVQLTVTTLVCVAPVTVTPQTNDRVVLNVTVTTEKHAPILDLTREHFSVDSDKRPQEILSFNADVPSSIGILIDTSASLHINDKKKRAQLKQNLNAGLERFVHLGHPDNEYFVMTFNKETELLQNWTSDLRSVTNKLNWLDFKGQTALYDSMIEAIHMVMKGRQTRRVLILVTDGNDSYSRNQNKDVRETLKRSDVLLYSIGVLDTSPDGVTDEELIEFVSYSGGLTAFSTTFAKSNDFIVAFETIARELKSQYQLTITPEQSDGKQKWRKLNVSVTRNDPSGKPQKLIVRTRKGYYR